LTVHRQTNLVFARQREWAVCALFVFEQVVSRYPAGSLVPFVPDESVKPRFRFDLLLRFFVVWIQRLLRRLYFVAGIFADHCTGGIEDLDGGFTFWRTLQVVIDDRARRRVLTGEDRFSFFVRRIVETIRGSGCVKVNVLSGDLVGELAQGRNVIENP